MEKMTVKLFQKTIVKDALGGGQEVMNYLRDITGQLVPATMELNEENNRVSIDTTMKFISDDRVSGSDLAVKIDGAYFNVESVKNLYHRGALMELKNNG